MAYYAVPGSISVVSNAYKTTAVVTAPVAPARRGKITEFYLGAISNPNSTDCAVQFDISRLTFSGGLLGTSWTPNATDPADGASTATATINATAESSVITANSSLYNDGINQRNTLRIMFPQESQYLIWPATSGNGLDLRVTSATFATSFAAGFTYLE